MRAGRLWDAALWATYGLIAYAIVLAWTAPPSTASTPGDAWLGIASGALLLVLVPWGWTRHRARSSRHAWRQLGWAWFPEWVATGAACGLLLFGAALPLLGSGSHLPRLAAILYGVAAAVMEEVFFRGHLQQRIGAWQILPFVALHGAADASTLLVVLAAGVLFTWLSRHGLGACIAAHAAFNLAATL